MKEITIHRSELQGAGIQPYVDLLLLGHVSGTLSAATMPKAVTELAARHNVVMALMMPDQAANFRGGNVWVTGWADRPADKDWQPERCRFVVEENLKTVTLELKREISGRVLCFDASIPAADSLTLGEAIAQCPELADQILQDGDLLMLVDDVENPPTVTDCGRIGCGAEEVTENCPRCGASVYPSLHHVCRERALGVDYSSSRCGD